MKVEDLIKQCVKDIVHLLVNKEYDKLNEQYVNPHGAMNWENLYTNLTDYWGYWDYDGIVSTPPIDAYEKIRIYEIISPEKAKREFTIEFDLWIDNERSDLTLICEVEYYGNNDLKVSIEDFHVM